MRNVQKKLFGIIKYFGIAGYFVRANAQKLSNSKAVCQEPSFGFPYCDPKQQIFWKRVPGRPAIKQTGCAIRVIKIRKNQYRFSNCHLSKIWELADQVTITLAAKSISDSTATK